MGAHSLRVGHRRQTCLCAFCPEHALALRHERREWVQRLLGCHGGEGQRTHAPRRVACARASARLPLTPRAAMLLVLLLLHLLVLLVLLLATAAATALDAGAACLAQRPHAARPACAHEPWRRRAAGQLCAQAVQGLPAKCHSLCGTSIAFPSVCTTPCWAPLLPAPPSGASGASALFRCCHLPLPLPFLPLPSRRQQAWHHSHQPQLEAAAEAGCMPGTRAAAPRARPPVRGPPSHRQRRHAAPAPPCWRARWPTTSTCTWAST